MNLDTQHNSFTPRSRKVDTETYCGALEGGEPSFTLDQKVDTETVFVDKRSAGNHFQDPEKFTETRNPLVSSTTSLSPLDDPSDKGY